MRKRLAQVLALVLLVGAGAAMSLAEDGIQWGSDLDAAKKTAAESKKLIQLNFWAEW